MKVCYFELIASLRILPSLKEICDFVLQKQKTKMRHRSQSSVHDYPQCRRQDRNGCSSFYRCCCHKHPSNRWRCSWKLEGSNYFNQKEEEDFLPLSWIAAEQSFVAKRVKVVFLKNGNLHQPLRLGSSTVLNTCALDVFCKCLCCALYENVVGKILTTQCCSWWEHFHRRLSQQTYSQRAKLLRTMFEAVQLKAGTVTRSHLDHRGPVSTPSPLLPDAAITQML